MTLHGCNRAACLLGALGCCVSVVATLHLGAAAEAASAKSIVRAPVASKSYGAHPIALRVRARRHDRVRAKLNGVPVGRELDRQLGATKRKAHRRHQRLRRATLSAGHGLRHGRNVLRVRVRKFGDAQLRVRRGVDHRHVGVVLGWSRMHPAPPPARQPPGRSPPRPGTLGARPAHDRLAPDLDGHVGYVAPHPITWQSKLTSRSGPLKAREESEWETRCRACVRGCRSCGTRSLTRTAGRDPLRTAPAPSPSPDAGALSARTASREEARSRGGGAS